MSAGSDGNLRHSLEVLRPGGNYDIYIPRATYDSPGIDSETAHHDKLHVCRRKAPKELVKRRSAQLWRDAPVNCINLWLSAIPSARFTLIGRRASSRNRCTRTASALATEDLLSCSLPFTKRMLAAAGRRSHPSSP